MRRRHLDHEPNTGMFADVSFLLLIFFMIVTTFNKTYELDMILPPKVGSALKKKISKARLLNIYLNDRSEYMIEDKVFSDVSQFSLVEELRRITSRERKGIIRINMLSDTNYDTYLKLIGAIERDKEILKETLANKLFDSKYDELSNKRKNNIIKRIKYSIIEKEI